MWKNLVAVCVFFAVCAYGGLIGGQRPIKDLDKNEGATKALKYVVHQHNSISNNTHLGIVSEVLSARSQVVAGMKYFFDVVMTKTNCTVDSVDEVCTITQEPEKIQVFASYVATGRKIANSYCEITTLPFLKRYIYTVTL
ncbi:hypothetical protein WMY93_018204 [Mugilogobius chulae]|uniref:Cystatin domain-containing protein n=1 Tax=Mugilogobius chulae TaxID=88201 RepID=A0AAW0NN72_9GOBI